jgi:hypothetical protein
MTNNINAIATANNINGDFFVVPNYPMKVSDWVIEEISNEMVQYGREISLLNNETFNEDDPFIQVWIKTDSCDNCNDHRFNVIIDDEVYMTRIKGDIPYSIIKDLKEGETKTIVFPCTAYNDRKERTKVNVPMTLTASQLKYRYRGFGTFHEVMNNLIMQ